ncbi:MAG: polymer-forming cytoskeletal protein [Deltaproteobacteria bacterium]|nr:polymer-forming cytoskeletal protein [Deltaproteobacteria bacterium]
MKKGKKHDSISTFLGSDASIDGTIEFRGAIRLDGNVKGKINSNGGTVIVGEKAEVDAKIAVGVAIIMGRVHGTIDAQDRIEIYPPGRVVGDIQAPVITVEEGGIFNGKCIMKIEKISLKKKKGILPKPSANEPMIDEAKKEK